MKRRYTRDRGGLPLDWRPSTKPFGFHDDGNVCQAEFESAVKFVPESRSISKVDGADPDGNKMPVSYPLKFKPRQENLWVI
jgi:hypothetical protein